MRFGENLRYNPFWNRVKNVVLIILGCFLLAFADAVFIVPNNLVVGGVASIGIIAQYFFSLSGSDFIINDIVVIGIQIITMILAFLFVGKKFAIHTLLASLVYPLFYSLFIRVDLGRLIGLGEFYNYCNPHYDFGTQTVVETIANPAYIGYLLLAGIFGGVLIGMGVGVALLGDGSTGGLDVIGEILSKATTITHNAFSFTADAILILIGLILFRDPVAGMVGIVGAFMCAYGIRFVYGYLNSYEVVQIISNNPEEIQKFIHEELEHASTLLDVVGGYSGQPKKMIQVVIYHREITLLRTRIAKIDPSAFVTYITARSINGDGFVNLTPNHEGITLFKHLLNKIKEKKKK